MLFSHNSSAPWGALLLLAVASSCMQTEVKMDDIDLTTTGELALTTPVGVCNSREIALENTGTLAAQIDTIGLSDSPWSVPSLADTLISPGALLYLSAQCCPTSPGEFLAEIELLASADGVSMETYVVRLQCNASEPDDDCEAAPEIADGVDQDCDGVIDNGTESADDDGDGYDERAGDCDDADLGANPRAMEVGDNGVDDDCDGWTDEGGLADRDGDGEADADDPDPLDSDIYKGGPCYDDDGDGYVEDADCDGVLYEDGDDCDDGCSASENAVLATWGRADCDDDGDGESEADGDPDDQYSGDGTPPYSCSGTLFTQHTDGRKDADDDGDGWSEMEWDCDDTTPLIYPSTASYDVIDGVDSDCDCEDS